MLVLLSAVSAVAVWQAAFSGTHGGFSPTETSLAERLSVVDLDRLSPAAQRRLIGELSAAFGAGFDWSAELARLEPPLRQAAARHADELSRRWFTSKVRAYSERPASDRSRYVDRELSGLLAWRLPSVRLGKSPTETGILTLRQLAAETSSQADVAQRERIEQFVQAVQARVLAQHLRRFLPAGT